MRLKKTAFWSTTALTVVMLAAVGVTVTDFVISPSGGAVLAQQNRSGGSDGSGQGSGGGENRGGSDNRGGAGAGTGAGGEAGGAGTGGQQTKPSDSGGQQGRPATAAPASEEGAGRPAGVGGPPDGKQGGRSPEEGEPTLGDLFGDLYVVERDANGVPILTDDGYLQPLDADGNPIPLIDGEVDPEYLDDLVTIDLGRLNLGRSAEDVLDGQLEEAIKTINLADDASAGESITLDAAGRIVVTYVDADTGELITKTIDSPLENLAIYEALLTDGELVVLRNLDEDPELEEVGITTSLLPDSLAYLADGEQDATDLSEATAYLAAATDKTGTFTVDEVAYINNILGIAQEELTFDYDGDGTLDPTGIYASVIDYSAFTYDREDTYNVEVVVLVPSGETWVDLDKDGVQDEGETFTTWEPDLVNIYSTVFTGEYTASETATITDFTQAADDAREVIEFIHEYAIPADSTTE
ncbi:hypothetical protein LZA78_15555 [Sinirhodobacter sp. WL0062]|uniref:Uncharacterized protein n=1 Tax=Rhodobacter flavimaris TaxID=2907145 RepID=A0ABS8YYK7_9RHOB|nr:hypothetical protein [Sinirhodobacter sp. WL0062]MCE5974902.1 hypothetical protein [Sinirhodobacter sp. WL0062]